MVVSMLVLLSIAAAATLTGWTLSLRKRRRRQEFLRYLQWALRDSQDGASQTVIAEP